MIETLGRFQSIALAARKIFIAGAGNCLELILEIIAASVENAADAGITIATESFDNSGLPSLSIHPWRKKCE